MTKRVKCISPHGGCHNGLRHNGAPVHLLPVYGADEAGNKILTGSYLPDVPEAELRLPANPGGWRHDSRIPGGYAAVGQEYDVDDGFYADGFHWSDVTIQEPPRDALDFTDPPPSDPPPPPDPSGEGN